MFNFCVHVPHTNDIKTLFPSSKIATSLLCLTFNNWGKYRKKVECFCYMCIACNRKYPPWMRLWSINRVHYANCTSAIYIRLQIACLPSSRSANIRKMFIFVFRDKMVKFSSLFHLPLKLSCLCSHRTGLLKEITTH